MKGSRTQPQLLNLPLLFPPHGSAVPSRVGLLQSAFQQEGLFYAILLTPSIFFFLYYNKWPYLYLKQNFLFHCNDAFASMLSSMEIMC